MPIIKDNSFPDLTPIQGELQQYITLKDEVETINQRVTTLKKRLTSYVEDLGQTTDKGSISLPVNDERTGVTAIVKQRRVTKQFDEETANALLKNKGLFESCTTTVVTLDQDAVMAAYYEGKLTDADIDSMFPEKVVWALVLEKK